MWQLLCSGCRRVIRLLTRSWPEVKLTERDVGKYWMWHKKLPNMTNNSVRSWQMIHTMPWISQVVNRYFNVKCQAKPFFFKPYQMRQKPARQIKHHSITVLVSTEELQYFSTHCNCSCLHNVLIVFGMQVQWG